MLATCPSQLYLKDIFAPLGLVLVVVSLIADLRNRSTALTSAEVCELINLHPVTLRDWTRAGRIPAYRIGREYRYDPTAIADWLQEREISRYQEQCQRRLPAFHGIETKKAA